MAIHRNSRKLFSNKTCVCSLESLLLKECFSEIINVMNKIVLCRIMLCVDEVFLFLLLLLFLTINIIIFTIIIIMF